MELNQFYATLANTEDNNPKLWLLHNSAETKNEKAFNAMLTNEEDALLTKIHSEAKQTLSHRGDTLGFKILATVVTAVVALVASSLLDQAATKAYGNQGTLKMLWIMLSNAAQFMDYFLTIGISLTLLFSIVYYWIKGNNKHWDKMERYAQEINKTATMTRIIEKWNAYTIQPEHRIKL